MNTPFSLTRRAFTVAVLTLVATIAVQAADQPKKLLVVTVTSGFRHSSIETAERIIEQIGKDSGVFTVDFARVTPPQVMNKPREPKATGNEKRDAEATKRYEDELAKYQAQESEIKAINQKYDADRKAVLAEKMSLASLKNYDGVIFANTTGELPLPDAAGFLKWIESGKAFIGMHSATDTFRTGGNGVVHPYVKMIGGDFKTHGPQVEVDALNEDKDHAACKHLPGTWTVYDEIYQLNNYDRSTVHGLLSLDKHPNDKTPGHYPISWCKNYGKGKVFYTSLGHREDMWDADPAMPGRKNSPEIAKAYQKHVLEGIKWALGLAKGDATPQH